MTIFMQIAMFPYNYVIYYVQNLKIICFISGAQAPARTKEGGAKVKSYLTIIECSGAWEQQAFAWFLVPS